MVVMQLLPSKHIEEAVVEGEVEGGKKRGRDEDEDGEDEEEGGGEEEEEDEEDEGNSNSSSSKGEKERKKGSNYVRGDTAEWLASLGEKFTIFFPAKNDKVFCSVCCAGMYKAGRA